MELTKQRSTYYEDMAEARRAKFYYNESGKLIGVLTFFVGSDDIKYMYAKEPWSFVDDNPDGDSVYIDQLITVGVSRKTLLTELREFCKDIKQQFPNVQYLKWVRVGPQLRKHGKKEGVSYGVFIKRI